MKRKGILTIVTLTGIAAAAVALAGKDAVGTRADEGIADSGTPKIHMIAAIAIAESATRGRAMQAELEADGERLAYEVEILVDRAIKKVAIDATTGEVLVTEGDAADTDEESAEEQRQG